VSLPIEDYALIGDTQTAALVSRQGSIDWLCLPRFDGGACFAALLGDETNGTWQLAPAGGVRRVRRRYRGETLVLETEFTTEDGTVRVVDCMPPRLEHPEVVRVVEGVRGRVPMRMQLVIRYDYGSIVPWVRRVDGDLAAVAGPDSLWLRTDVRPHGENMTSVAEFAVSEGQRVPFVLSWCPSTDPPGRAIDAAHAVRDTEQWWGRWSERCQFPEDSPYRGDVVRSLITLKALTYEPTGGMVAAATTSLPEQLGGVRNWDYRFCWLRDATFTLWALLCAGYVEEASAWRDWLLRAAAGDPAELQIMYGPAGERRLSELELPWLPGYEGSKPVRVGNAASEQFQLDVYGEVVGVAAVAAEHLGFPPPPPEILPRWNAFIEFIEQLWQQPDDGIWEARGPRRHFTHSKVMAWVVFEAAIMVAERLQLDLPVDRWKRVRQEIHDDVCEKGYDAQRNTFTQYYGSKELDASTLTIPLVGFLPGDDPRVTGTIDAVSAELGHDGFISRYSTAETDDGLPGTEGQFLACSFWLVSALALNGRVDEARKLFERLLALSNDVGLLAEEYDVPRQRQVGNFPQAFSHLALIQAANFITQAGQHK
jgi:GH15 family glucan-1,4-alpha-glucosidase